VDYTDVLSGPKNSVTPISSHFAVSRFHRYQAGPGTGQHNKESARTSRKNSLSAPRGGGGRAGGPAPERPQFHGGISRDNPQFHTFPRSRRRQPPDPEKYAPAASGSHVGPAQRRILNRKLQQQREQQQTQHTNETEETFTEVLRSKSSSAVPKYQQLQQQQQLQEQQEQHQLQEQQEQQQQLHGQQQQQQHGQQQQQQLAPPEATLSTSSCELPGLAARSYASTLASGLDVLLQQQSELAQRRPVAKTDAGSIYKSQPQGSIL
jgi:hypothetical protein